MNRSIEFTPEELLILEQAVKMYRYAVGCGLDLNAKESKIIKASGCSHVFSSDEGNVYATRLEQADKLLTKVEK